MLLVPAAAAACQRLDRCPPSQLSVRGKLTSCISNEAISNESHPGPPADPTAPLAELLADHKQRQLVSRQVKGLGDDAKAGARCQRGSGSTEATFPGLLKISKCAAALQPTLTAQPSHLASCSHAENRLLLTGGMPLRLQALPLLVHASGTLCMFCRSRSGW